MNGRISRGPSEQFKPTPSKPACEMEFQNASIVCPDCVRPLRSTKSDAMTGTCRPASSKYF